MGRKRKPHGGDPDGSTYEACGDPLLVALFEGDESGARQLIESNACDVEAMDQLGWRPLHRASYAGLDGTVSLLLQRGADPTAADPDGATPLHVAASRGHLACCRLLVAAGADPTQPDGLTGMTPQIYAMSKEDGLAKELGEVLGAVDWRLLAAWSSPLEMAKLVSEAKTEEEQRSLENKFMQSLDDPAGCVHCEDDPELDKTTRTYTWGGKTNGLWDAAMREMPELEDKLWIQDWDRPVLEHCDNVISALLDSEDPRKGFKLVFNFVENPHFTNCKLEKAYYTEQLAPNSGQVGAVQIECTKIDWKPGGDVTMDETGGENHGRRRFSFFRNFFCEVRRGGALPPHFDAENVRKRTGMDSTEKMLEMLMGVEHELGCCVRDQLVPFAARWCTDDDAGVAPDGLKEPRGEHASHVVGGGDVVPGGDID